jgi:hypothetical protein
VSNSSSNSTQSSP